jgi:formiminoglutamase
MSNYLQPVSPEELNSLINQRSSETKLGEKLVSVGLSELKSSPVKWVLMGIEEDIGIRANLGYPGAADAWNEFLPAFLNIQNNRFIEAASIGILGSLKFPEWQSGADKLNASQTRDLNLLRTLTNNIDVEVSNIVNQVVKSGKIPIIIGGGHNNSYPIIKGVSEAKDTSVNVVNIDPHTDYRKKEGRHSGNGFRYAREGGYLDRYAVFGLHQSYNAEDILEEFSADPHLHYVSFEELLTLNESELRREWANTINWLESSEAGLEIDMDSITGFPVSAYNPSGFSLNQIRMLIRLTGMFKSISYLHLAEASPGRAQTRLERAAIGKSLSYLVTDFIKAGS